MGQADVLPDSLDESASSVASADDLLSQLAGEEIDRLLAESQTEAVPDPAPQDTPLPVPEVSGDSTSVDLTTLARDATEEVAAHAPPPSSPPPKQPMTQPLEPAINTAERAALRIDPISVKPARAPHESEDHLPLYFKPLEWLNAPLAVFPDAVREALGKVAIVTLVNAIAVLLYVVLFRKH